MEKQRFPIIWLLCFMIGGAVWFGYFQYSTDQERERTQTAYTQAKILSIDRNNHGLIHYEYVVAGKTYESDTTSGLPISPGDSVIMHYNPNDPSINTLGEGKPMALDGYVKVILLIEFFIAGTFCMLWFRLCKSI